MAMSQAELEAKYAEKTANKGPKFVAAVRAAAARNAYAEGLRNAGLPAGPVTTSNWAKGVESVTAEDYANAVRGKASKWYENLVRGLSL
jgi:hypothetical protein